MTRRIKMIRSKVKTPLVTPAFLPGRRGGANWHITDAGDSVPSTLAVEGVWNVPFGDEQTDKYIRFHELLHAAHSPMDSPVPIPRPGKSDISVIAILLAEECRIDGYARGKLGMEQLPVENLPNAKEISVKLLSVYAKTKNPKFISEAVQHFFASWMSNPYPLSEAPVRPRPEGFTKEENERYDKLNNILWKIQEHVYWGIWNHTISYLMAGEMVSWDKVVLLAGYIQNILDNIDELADEGDGGEAPEDMKTLEKLSKKNPDKKIDEINKYGGDPPDKRNGDEPLWAKMRKRIANLSKKLPGKKTAKSKWTATDMGVAPRNIHRLTIDGQVFARKRRQYGGSVLIDDSGSMRWSAEELERVVLAAPASIIAAYSGYSYEEAELVIVAQDQKWADVNDKKNRPIGGGNECDLPALEWLGEQAKPRIWVTDQQVVPSGGDSAIAAKQCMDFCIANDINIVRYARQAADVFEGKRAIYR